MLSLKMIEMGRAFRERRLAIHPNSFFIVEIHALLLLVLLVWGLATCFLGYPLFRVLLATFGAAAGMALGTDLVGLLRETPGNMDYIVACGALCILGALLAWYLYRWAFALAVGWVVTALMSSLVGWFIGSPGSVLSWVIGALFGLAVAVIAYSYLRLIVIVASSAVGAVMTAYAGALLCTGSRTGEQLIDATFGDGGRPWVAWFVVLMAVVLAAVGMVLQTQLVHAVGERFTPRILLRRRKGGRSTKVQPRFTRI